MEVISVSQPPSDSPHWVLRAWKQAEELADPCQHPGEVVLSALDQHEAELTDGTAELNEQQKAVRERLDLE